LIDEKEKLGDRTFTLTKEGEKLIGLYFPTRDNVWKMIIFDIPESKRKIRNFLRARLVSLGFKRWQNSIWVTPYALHKDFEEELGVLAKSLFIRLIKTTDINYTKDLEKLFPME
jgi:CRISPR-associated endonuclease Cas2